MDQSYFHPEHGECEHLRTEGIYWIVRFRGSPHELRLGPSRVASRNRRLKRGRIRPYQRPVVHAGALVRSSIDWASLVGRHLFRRGLRGCLPSNSRQLQQCRRSLVRRQQRLRSHLRPRRLTPRAADFGKHLSRCVPASAR